MDGSQPAYDTPGYRSTGLRAPLHAPVDFALGLTEARGPRFSPAHFPPLADLTHVEGGEAPRGEAPRGEALGQRIIVAGRVSDEDGRAVAGAMIELWQANAAGRYHHPTDQHDAPLDPHFRGAGRVFTDPRGEYRFLTVRPGSYPWRNHENAWRPSHIHFSLFGPGFAQRLITQMYFEGDPLLSYDPIFNSVPDRAARERLVARFEIGLTEPEWALGYRFDIVLRGRRETPQEG
jgi:protocatechuate 3,4-dioxygenase, beta subunit